jgi:6-pyruvoyltetrahydropterin/6-carboxytetrahydropterin synthase
MFTIGKRFSFSASHQSTGLPDEHPCSRLHGHNYDVEVVSGADDLDAVGFVHDYADIDPLRRLVAGSLDHRHLNDVLPGPTTAEAIAWWVYERAKEVLDPAVAAKVVAVRVSETPSTWAEYRPSSP